MELQQRKFLLLLSPKVQAYTCHACITCIHFYILILLVISCVDLACMPQPERDYSPFPIPFTNKPSFPIIQFTSWSGLRRIKGSSSDVDRELGSGAERFSFLGVI